MSTFVRNTRSSSNLGLQNKPSLNKQALNKPTVQNGLIKNQSLATKQPLKRSALTSTTNLLNNLNAGNRKVCENEDKQIKNSTSENAFGNEFKATAKGLGGLNKASSSQSKIPIKNGLKLKQQQQINQHKQINKQQQIKKQIKIEEENILRFSSFKIPDNVENIDQYDANNVLLACDFSNDIYIYLRHLETTFKLKSNFLQQTQQQMTSKMRARLIDWIIAVHHKFKLLSETLYLTIAIMDRFLEKENVTKEKVQLVGLTAFFIACKYEEIYPPEIDDFLKVCDAYSKNDILKMEKTILKALDFNLSYPLPLHFLRRFSKAAYADQEIHTLAKYIMELGLVEYECSSWKPSLLAAASLYLTLKILSSNDQKWTKTLAFYTEYTEDELKPYVITLCKILIMTKDSKLQTVNKKYSSLKLLNISNSPKLRCDYVLEMSDKCI